MTEYTEDEYARDMAGEGYAVTPDVAAAASVASAGPAQVVGQHTMVEQARAQAEVQGAIVVAQQVPRVMAKSIEAMNESTSQLGLAERAFFRFPRGREAVTGPTVHLARELARCFGNVQYGVAEMLRDDEAGRSEMQAFAWDVQQNVRASTTFIVPHGRDTKRGRQPLVELRDVYENNANMGARRLREMIFAVLPVWFTEDAKERCRATIQRGTSNEPIAQQVAKIVAAFAGQGVTVKQLEEKQGRLAADFTGADLVQLRIIGKSLAAGEITRDEEFPPVRVSAAEIKGATT